MDNPADLATRGITTQALKDDQRWWHGPPWLEQPPSQWPTTVLPAEGTELEKRAAVLRIGTAPKDSENLSGRFSSLTRLIRVVAYLQRFAWNSRHRVERRVEHITTLELEDARRCILRMNQAEHYTDEIQDLKAGKNVKITSKIKALRPFLDETGILRVGGRLGLAKLDYDRRHPALIDQHSTLAELIVRAAHHSTLHGGLSLTQCTVRQSYWIPQDRILLKRVLRSCVRCTRFQGTTCKQQMGTLPVSRVQPAPAFYRSGVDYAGPIELCMNRGRGQKTLKGYIAVFVCLCTKAVHLEAVTDLSASAFIAAFRRFVSRRGRCGHLLSDNATTFRGADAQLKSMFKRASEFYREVAELIANDETNWEFIPPYSPHFGGLWEAAVKSAKRHLLRSVKDHRLTFEELTTLLCQIEACLNSRPLTPITDDADDLNGLTPNHLITGHALHSLPESPEILNFNGGHSRWSLIQNLTEHFWRRWSREYLGQLQHLPKWQRIRENLTPGTLVLLKDDATPPTKWPMARVIHVHQGPDGLTRVATVKTVSRTTTRAITRLVPLLTDDEARHKPATSREHS